MGSAGKKQLAWCAAGPAAGLGGESTVAIQHILIVLAHQLLGPRLQIWVLGVGHALHHTALITRPLGIGWVETNRRDLPGNGAEIDAALKQPAKLSRCEIRDDGVFCRHTTRGAASCKRADQGRTPQRTHFEHSDTPQSRRRPEWDGPTILQSPAFA